MIIGDFGDELGKCVPCTIQQRAAQRRRLRALRNRRRATFRDAEFGAVEPYMTMAAGVPPAWTPRDPRSQLTNVAAMAYQQARPSLNGTETGLLARIRAWFRGER